MNHEGEKEILDPGYWLEKIKTPFPAETSKKKTKRYVAPKRFNIFEYAPAQVMQDEALMIQALQENKIYFSELPDTLRHSKPFVDRCLDEVKYFYFFVVPEELRRDEDLALKAIARDAQALRSLPYGAKYSFSDKPGVLRLLDVNPKVFEFLRDSYRDDVDIARHALEKDPYNIAHMKKSVSYKVCREKAFCQELLERNLQVFPYLHKSLREDEEFVRPYLQQDRNLVQYLGKKLLGKKEFIKDYLGCYQIWDLLPPELRDDRDMVKGILRHHYYAYYYFKQHPDIKEIMLENIRHKDIFATRYYDILNDEEKKDIHYINALLTHDTYEVRKFSSTRNEQSIIYLLPESVQKELWQDVSELEQQGHLVDDLTHARNKYLRLCLEADLASKGKQPRLKI